MSSGGSSGSSQMRLSGAISEQEMDSVFDGAEIAMFQKDDVILTQGFLQKRGNIEVF